MSRWWRLYLPGYVVSALQTVGYALFALVVYRAHKWRIIDGVLTFIARRPMRGNPGGQGIGGLCVGYATEKHRDRPDLRVHETDHVWQGMLLGPLFLVIYGGDFLWQRFKVWRDLRQDKYRTRFFLAAPCTDAAIRTSLIVSAGAQAVKIVSLRLGTIDIVMVGGDLETAAALMPEIVDATAQWRLRRPWWLAYRQIGFERHARRIQQEYAEGKRPNAWGAR